MKKYFFPIVLLLIACVVAYQFRNNRKAVAQSKNTSAVAIKWEGVSRTLLSDFDGAHDPRLALSPNGNISLLAVGRQSDSAQVQLFMSHDDGDEFSHSMPVSQKGDKVGSSGENSPVMTPYGEGTAIAWAQGGNMVSVLSAGHGGGGFSKPVRINDGPEDSSAYFGYMSGNGKLLGAAWLDGRDKSEKTEHEAHSDAMNDVTSVYFALSSDGGKTWSKNTRVTDQSCACCRPKVAFFPNGKIMVAWRNVYPGSIRDMASAVSDDGGKTWSKPSRVAVDNWQLTACPVSGPRLATVGNRVYASWFSMGTGKDPGIRLTWSDDNGATWQKPIMASASTEDAAQPYLYVDSSQNVYLTFRARDPEVKGEWPRLRPYVVEVGANGELTKPEVIPGEKSVSYPVMIADQAGRIWVSWNEGGEVKMQRGRKVF